MSIDGGFEYRLTEPGMTEDEWSYLAVDPSGLEREATVALILNAAPPPDDLIFGDSFEDALP